MSIKKEGKKIGKVVHYFNDIGVAILKLSGSLAVGEKIRVVGGEDTDFTEQVKSMEFNHKKIKRAKKGQEVGVKVSKRAREGYIVYKL